MVSSGTFFSSFLLAMMSFCAISGKVHYPLAIVICLPTVTPGIAVCDCFRLCSSVSLQFVHMVT